MSFDIIENFKILPFLVFVLQRIYRTDKEPKISGIIAHALRKKNTLTHLELQHTTEDCSTNKIPVASNFFYYYYFFKSMQSFNVYWGTAYSRGLFTQDDKDGL